LDIRAISLVLLAHRKECFMHNPKVPGKLLTFPPHTLSTESVEQWIDQVLRTKDQLVDALEFLRTAYNEMLAGVPVREVDEVMAQVDAILKSDKTMKKYTVVGVVRTRGPGLRMRREAHCSVFRAAASGLLILGNSGTRQTERRVQLLESH
jgi:hypothetical protein